jgi:ABC-type bacteriocin/lantibiotic exporter with double-glycine peptidase domain
VAIALLGGLLVLRRGESVSVIPLLGSLALGAQRLLPALQQIYGGWSALKGYNASLQSVLEILNQPLPPHFSVAEPLLLQQGIRFEGVHFCYGIQQPDVLNGLDLEICLGERVGLIGSTGSGKSTTVDLLMGLLVPTAGRLLVDGVDLHDPKHPGRLVAWHRAIAHVPQSIYMADSSIAENIAFGVPCQHINMARVKQAAELAQIHSFIENSPQGYESFVGERGIRLSGGQRQRIGIARALYKHAQVIVFDEATSALDGETESSVIDSLGALSDSLTVVIVAHRLSTLAHCNRVFKLGNGVVEKIFSPKELLHT